MQICNVLVHVYAYVFCRDAMGLNLPARACGEGERT